MNDLPKIDPSWNRKRTPAPREDSITAVVLVALAILLPAIGLARTHFEFESAQESARIRSQALAGAAHARLIERLENERAAVHYILEAQAKRELAADRRSTRPVTSGQRCVSASGGATYRGPCSGAWVDPPRESAWARERNIAEQARMRMRAEALLREQERQFVAQAGQPGSDWRTGYPVNPREAARQRCATATVQRDEAYRIVGNQRTYEFIRAWDDFVAKACRDT
jgi:hypothetical protein